MIIFGIRRKFAQSSFNSIRQTARSRMTKYNSRIWTTFWFMNFSGLEIMCNHKTAGTSKVLIHYPSYFAELGKRISDCTLALCNRKSNCMWLKLIRNLSTSIIKYFNGRFFCISLLFVPVAHKATIFHFQIREFVLACRSILRKRSLLVCLLSLMNILNNIKSSVHIKLQQKSIAIR